MKTKKKSDEVIKIILDQEPIKPAGTKQRNDKTCRTGDEERRGACSRSSSTRASELPLKNHQQVTYFKENDRARTQLDRPYMELEHIHLTGAVTKPWKLPLEESTRAFHRRINIHSETTYLEDFDRTRMHQDRTRIKDGQETSLGTLTEPWKLPLGESTRSFHLSFIIHQKTNYCEGLGRAKLPKESANWKESNLKQFGRFTLSEPTNPDRSSSSHALRFYNSILKTPCCFSMPKTASKPDPHICPRRSHFPYPDLPYLDQGAFKPQRLLSDPLRHESRHIQDLQTVPRHSSFGPKLSRLKPSRNLPYLADFILNSPTAIFSFNSAISFLF